MMNLLNFAGVDWPDVLLAGSIALLLCGILLKLRVGHKDANESAAPPERNTIGQYRPQVYR
jgi:hypothetical protein